MIGENTEGTPKKRVPPSNNGGKGNHRKLFSLFQIKPEMELDEINEEGFSSGDLEELIAQGKVKNEGDGFYRLTPLEEQQVQARAALASDGEEGDRKLSKTDKLIFLGLTLGDIFRDEHGSPFIAVEKSENLEVMPLRGQRFKTLLQYALWKHEGEASNSEAINAALNTLEGISLEKPRETLHLRVAWGSGGITEYTGAQKHPELLYDPGREDWQIIKITPTGWTWAPHDRPIFRRYDNMKAQVDPDPEATPEDFLRILKHVWLQEGEEVIFVGLLATYIVPEISHCIININGPHGSAKTTTQRFMRKVIDPSSLDVMGMPRKLEDLIQKFQHHYITFFDNVDRLSREESDIFCRASTGESNSKRQLYTDDDEFIFSFRRCPGTNGLNLASTMGDYQDRSINFNLKRIPVTHRRREHEVIQEFDNDLPKIVGGLLKATSKALNIVDKVDEELTGKLPRMADFTVWGEALARAMGYEPMEFYEAYKEKIRQQNREVITGNIIGEILLSWIDKQPENTWEGSPTALLKELTEEANDVGVSEKQKGFPQAPNSLSRKLNELKTNLEEEGVVIEKTREGRKRKRQLRIYKKNPPLPNNTPQKPSAPSDRPQPGPKDADDNADDISGGKNTVRRPSATKPGPMRTVDDADDICGYSSSKRITQNERLQKITAAIGRLERQYGTAKVEEIKACLGEALKANLEQDLQKLKDEGVIFEPKHKEYKVVSRT